VPEAERQLVEAVGDRRPGLAAPLDRLPLETGAGEHRPALRLALGLDVAGQELLAGGLESGRRLH
jgi:hypothetical protein